MVKDYRPDIDGLRAIAVLAIIFFHLDLPPFHGGYVGVDIFFVISGYLITSIILREIATGSFAIIRFYERRVRRILPALAVVLVATLAAGGLLLGPAAFAELARSAVATSLFGSNVFFLHGAGYFDGVSESKPLLHTWSLAVEEQFYILFPAVLLLIAHRAAARYTRWLAGMTILSFCAGVWMTARDPSAAFYLIPFRAWELLVGSLLALAVLPVVSTRRSRDLLAAAGLVCIGISVFTFTPSTPFPGVAAALPVLGSALVIHAGIGGQGRISRLIAVRPMVFVGLISYSLYLWHWPLVVYAKHWLINEPTDAERALILIATFALAALSWRYVENPFRDRRRLDQTAVFRLAAVAFGVILSASLAVTWSGGLPGRDRGDDLQAIAVSDPGWQHWKECAEPARDPGAPLDLCALGRADAPASFLLWGDSHALAMASAVDLSAARNDVSGVLAARTACPPLLGIDGPGDDTCRHFNETVLAYVEADPGIDTVILAARWALSWHGTRFGAEEGSEVRLADAVGAPATNPELLERGLARTVAALERLDRRVVLVRQVPEVGEDVPSANYAARLSGRDVEALIAPTRAAYEQRTAAVHARLEAIASGQATVLDPGAVLCDASHCRVTLDGLPLYRDDNHLSLRGCVAIAELFDPLFAAP
jgi:peptidoglycan/LPS O-acetylase OafA/YrhL